MDRALRDWTEAELPRIEPHASGPLEWQALAVEASHRRFYRVRWSTDRGRRSLIAMSSPPQLENNGQFVALAGLFAEHGIGVPRLLATAPDAGFFLMTDLGSRHLADVYRDPGPDAVLPAALATLHRLQAIRHPRIPPYTVQRFRDELGIYVEWFLGRLLELEAPAALDDVFAVLVAATQAQPECCVHRDFHSRNLLRTDSGDVGVVDFQDALMGPATYDLASLLRDCYYRFDEADVARWRDTYLAATPLDVDHSRFPRDLDLTALQRQLKAVGIFARLHLRDGRDSHLMDIVPVLGRIGELAGAYGELAPLAGHVSAVLPVARRRLGLV